MWQVKNRGRREAQVRMEQMLSKLKGRGFRITYQRVAILAILADSKEHPSVEEIHKAVKLQFPATSLATVYNTVSLLKELNEVLELGFPDGSNRYDGNKPYPHPHVICMRCKKVMDPELVHLGEISEEMSLKTGYKIFSHRLDFFGLCPECQKKEEVL
jgi:Fur family transcriptional regulator, peroxide stress response regulator